MKKILIVISCLGLGGGERSLINLLNMFDYSKYSVDLLLLTDGGPLAKQIPTNVKILKKYLFTKPSTSEKKCMMKLKYRQF